MDFLLNKKYYRCVFCSMVVFFFIFYLLLLNVYIKVMFSIFFPKVKFADN
ncbi:hypothetical protein HanPSC8_Chr09g0359491 [Helianthus annuus]|nr:hypothetical protein HanPSC8_Chr09g0359491 [Helianthus annuus]